MTFARLGGSGMTYPQDFWTEAITSRSQAVLDATSERVHMVGQVYIDGGPDAGPKTLSSAGGKMMWMSGNSLNVFADVGSNLRVGLQDVDVTTRPAHGDHTFDVYADLVGGTATLTNSTPNETAMITGTKTLTHGDLVAFAFDLTAKAGSDVVTVAVENNDLASDTTKILPGAWLDDGSPAAFAGNLICALEFDDGTIGWLTGGWTGHDDILAAFSSATAVADEYGNLFIPEFDMKVSGALMRCIIGTNADAEILLYSDPLGTPIVMGTYVVDSTGTVNLSTPLSISFNTEHILRAGTAYGLTLRPTTTNSVQLYGWDSLFAGKYWRAMGMTEDSWYAIRRLDNTGPFSTYSNSGTDKDRRMLLTLKVSAVRVNKGNASFNLGT